MELRALGWRNNTPAVEQRAENQSEAQDNDDQQDTIQRLQELQQLQDLHNEIIERKLKIADELASVTPVGKRIKLPLDDVDIEPPIDWDVELRMVAGDHDLMVIGAIGSVATLQVCSQTLSAAD